MNAIKRRLLMCMFLTFLMVFMPLSYSINAFAAETEDMVSPPDNFGEPISVTTYIDDDGFAVTEKVYVVLDDGMARSKSGAGWYKNEKTKEWESGSVSTYYAQGYFTWGDGDVSVSYASGSISSSGSNITVSNRNTSSGTGRYGYVFNKYAYVTFSCTATNAAGMSQDLSVTIRVSESGNTI
jgi:hypothetical protein